MELKRTFTAKLWIWETEKAAWHFVTLPKKLGREIQDLGLGSGKAFRSVKVAVEADGEKWSTSLFPDTKAGSYMLPVKKDIREKLKIGNGSRVEITLTFRA